MMPFVLLAQNSLDEDIALLENSKGEKAVSNALLHLAELHYNNTPDTVLYFVQKFENKVPKNWIQFARIKSFESSAYYNKRDYESFKRLNEEVLRLSKGKGKEFEPLYYLSLLNIGLANYKNKQFEEAEKIYLEVIAATETKFDSIAAKGMSHMARTKLDFGLFEESELWSRKAIPILEKSNNERKLLSVLNNLAASLNEQGNLEEAKKIYLKILGVAERIEYHKAIAVFTHNLGTCYKELNDYDSAVYYYEISYDLKKKYHPGGIPSLLNDYANLYRGLKQFEKAIKLYKEAFESNLKNNLGGAFYNCKNIVVTYLDMQEFASAHDYSKKMNDLATEMGNPHFIGMSHLTNAQIYKNEGKFALAKKEANKAKENIIQGNIKGLDNTLLNVLGDVQLGLGEYREALNTFRLLQQNELVDYNQKVSLYQGMSGAFYGLNQQDSGAVYNQFAMDYKDSIFFHFNTKNVEEAKAKFDTDLAEAREEVAIQKAKRESQFKVFFLCLFGLSVFSLFFIVNRQKKLTKLKEAKREVEKEKILKQIEHSKEVLLNQSNLIKDKNRIINELKEFLNKFSDQKISKEMGAEATTILEGKILTKEDWVNFKVYFSTLFPNYVQHVKENFEGITEAEERYLYLRRLDLDKNEIADMLGVLPRSINKTRSRLLNKFGLENDEALNKKLEINESKE